MASSPMSDSTKLRQEAGSELSTCMFSQYFGQRLLTIYDPLAPLILFSSRLHA